MMRSNTSASGVSETGLPAQSSYLNLLPNEGSGMNQRVSAFAFVVANYVRPLWT